MKVEMKYFIICLLMMIGGNDAINVYAKYGHVTIEPPMNCLITVNDTDLNITNGNVVGLHYGLIEYTCEKYHGYILSKPECFECGLYCPQNDKLLNCRQFALPYVLGFITAGILSFAIILFMHKYGFGWISIVLESMKRTKKVRRENRYAKYINRLHSHNGLIYRPTTTQDNDNIETINTSSRNTYPSLTSLAVGTLLLTADRTYACDRTLFMHSNGQICDKNKCQEISSYVFNIGLGNTICFNTPSRDLMRFQITNTMEVATYQELYETSDFDIELESTSNCKQQGLCFKENCYKNAKHPDFSNKTGVHGYDCDTEGLGCEFMCWHKYACTWYNWWIKETGMRASVLKRVSTIWAFDLLVAYKDTIKRYSFSSDITQFDLDIGKLFSLDNMPINVNNIMKTNYYHSDYLLKDEFVYYEVEANDINSVTPGRIGDYQISLDNAESIYKNNEVNCKTTGCKTKCSAPEPSLRLFRAMSHKTVVKEYSIMDHHTVRVLNNLPMTASLSIGNVEFKNLFVEQASCDFTVLETFGCIGCNKIPYAVIQPFKVVNHGSIPFISNCTFNTKVLYCSDNMYKLIPVQKYNTCNIYLQSINKSLDISFKYEFYGELTIPESIYSKDIGFAGILSNIADNPNFVDTITYGLFAFTGLGLGLSIISKIIMRALILRRAQKSEKDMELSTPVM